MKILFICGLLGVALSAGQQLCPTYYCDEFPGTSAVTQPEWYFCAELLQSRQMQAASSANVDFYDTIFLGACPQDTKHTICNVEGLSQGQGTFCTPTTRSNLFPGEACGKNSECVSSVCTDGKCTGLTEGQSCDSTDKCGTGLYCKSSTCTKVAALD